MPIVPILAVKSTHLAGLTHQTVFEYLWNPPATMAEEVIIFFVFDDDNKRHMGTSKNRSF